MLLTLDPGDKFGGNWLKHQCNQKHINNKHRNLNFRNLQCHKLLLLSFKLKPQQQNFKYFLLACSNLLRILLICGFIINHLPDEPYDACFCLDQIPIIQIELLKCILFGDIQIFKIYPLEFLIKRFSSKVVEK